MFVKGESVAALEWQEIEYMRDKLPDIKHSPTHFFTVHAGRWGVRPEKDCSIPSLSLLVFMGLQYRSKVECNLMRECNSSVAGQHPACCSLTVRVPTLPFMPLPVPSR
jgi:hypothetical protein